MKKAILFPVLVLLLLGSCQALHRDIPKADGHYRRRVLTASAEEEELPAGRVLLRSENPKPQIAEKPEAAGHAQQVVVVPEDETTIPVAAVRSHAAVVPQGDTLTEDTEPETLDEAALEEAYESERIARSAYRFSFLPAFSLIFFPLLLVGVIGTLTQLARFRRFEYVTEAALDYEERAKRTLIISIVVPIVVTVLLILLILALL